MRNAARIEVMPLQGFEIESRRYAKCMEGSRRVRWDIDRDALTPIATAGAAMKKLAQGLRKFASYITVAIFVPGGMVLAPLMWVAQQRRKAAA